MPEGDVSKIAGVIIAAEAWARSGDELAEDLAAEVAESRWAFKRVDDELYVARREAHRKEWRGLRLVRGGAYADTEEFRAGVPDVPDSPEGGRSA